MLQRPAATATSCSESVEWQTQASTRNPQLEQPADWSPDGKRILFTRFYLAGGSDVFVIDVDGSPVRRLTRAPGEDTAAAWSPDGSKIVFTSERTGRPQVFVMDADGSNQRNISRTRSGDFATDWH